MWQVNVFQSLISNVGTHSALPPQEEVAWIFFFVMVLSNGLLCPSFCKASVLQFICIQLFKHAGSPMAAKWTVAVYQGASHLLGALPRSLLSHVFPSACFPEAAAAAELPNMKKLADDR